MPQSVQSRLVEWLIWLLPFKRRFEKSIANLPDFIQKGRPKDPRPPAKLRKRFAIGESTHQGYKIFTIAPKDHPTKRHILYLHGGAYVGEIENIQFNFAARLADLTGAAITIPLYPLAPESTCTQAFEWLLPVYDQFVQSSGDLPTVLLGDSAGGGMALALAQQLRDAGKPLPGAMVLLSPWLDVTCSDPNQDLVLNKRDPMLSLPAIRQDGLWYAGSLDPRDPRVSPLFGEMHGLPRTLVLTGTHDVLYSDARRLEPKLPDLAPGSRVSIYPNMLHVWAIFSILPEARQALNEIAAFLSL